jgi:hypothetical protein
MNAALRMNRLKAFPGLIFSRFATALLMMPGEYSAVGVVVKRIIR